MMSYVAQKKFGQNFLHDQNIIKKIISSVAPQKQDLMVEIGPGLGALTKPLLEQVDNLHVIELDKNILPKLIDYCENDEGLKIYKGDAVKFDYSQLLKNELKMRLVGNLPYNISTPLLFRLITYLNQIQDMHFMLQKEVAERITAAPNTPAYGRLSVMVQSYFKTEILFYVKASCFTPKPKVESAVIRFVPLQAERAHIEDPVVFEKIVKIAFSQRRKMLSNTLKVLMTVKDFKHCEIDSNLRAENLSVDDFARLANYVTLNQKKTGSKS